MAAANVLDIAALIDPSKISAKAKYHLLPHLREDIIRFGPIIGLATEVFESFNAIFRYCSILSNSLAPSRDIAYQLAAQESVKHFLCGGWWETTHGEWCRPGLSVRRFMAANPILQTLYGWTSSEFIVPGTVKLEPLKRGLDMKLPARTALLWTETQAATAVNNVQVTRSLTSTWYRCRNLIAVSQETCIVGSWVFAKSPLAVGRSYLFMQP